MTFVLSITIIAVIGFIAQRIGICLIRGVGQAMSGRPALLMAILLSGCWLWVYFLISSQMGWVNHIPRYDFHPIFFAGGLLFGVGAALNQACSVSTLNRFTQGDLSMLLTMLGWALGWCLWMSFSMQNLDILAWYQQTDQISDQTAILLFLPALALTLWQIRFNAEQRGLWIGIMCFGLLATVLFLLQPDWPPSRLIQDSGEVVFNSEVDEWPSLQRYALMLALFFGMWLAAVQGKQFRIRKIKLSGAARHGFAGCLMGMGGAIALGGNDSHLLLGLPTMSFASVAAMLGMILGITLETSIYRKIVD